MSLKAIEMQIALPRTHDAGKILDQLQQRGQINQAYLTEEANKEQEKKRVAILKQEAKDNVHLKNDQASVHKNKSKRADIGTINEEELEVKHPYKGTRIDFSG